jgi:hypothetical protein
VIRRKNLSIICLASLVTGVAYGQLFAKEGELDAGAGAAKAAIAGKDAFDCGGGKPGWKRAQAVTPNLVPPCNAGSAGKCEGPQFEYVTGTGWCRPRQ